MTSRRDRRVIYKGSISDLKTVTNMGLCMTFQAVSPNGLHSGRTTSIAMGDVGSREEWCEIAKTVPLSLVQGFTPPFDDWDQLQHASPKQFRRLVRDCAIKSATR